MRENEDDMRKIPSLFVRDWNGDKLATDAITPGCEWVAGDRDAIMGLWKLDGTACMIRGSGVSEHGWSRGKLYKRYDAKKGRTPPPDFEPCDPAPDPVTGHWPGWVPVGDGPEDAVHRSINLYWRGDGTYELVGPKVNGNPHGIDRHCLVYHGALAVESDELPKDLTSREQWKEFLSKTAYEGVVLINLYDGSPEVPAHFGTSRLCKVKRTDFGLPWPFPK